MGGGSFLGCLCYHLSTVGGRILEPEGSGSAVPMGRACEVSILGPTGCWASASRAARALASLEGIDIL